MTRSTGDADSSVEQVRAIVRTLEREGVVTAVEEREPHPGMLDVTFVIGDEAMLVMVIEGQPDVRIVGRRREYDRPVDELADVLRSWTAFRRGWHS
ncbi:MAG: hypothetical protein U0R68_08205 [Candidatus Nanopelagicales bacterium]